jgi:hypothetical protein
MPDRLTIEIFGLLHGVAEGPLAIGALVLIALAVTRRFWCPQRDHRLDPPPSDKKSVPQGALEGRISGIARHAE